MSERIISARSYCEAIALAFIAAPDGSDDERALDAALTSACDRAGLTTDEVLQAVCDEHGALYVEGADDAPCDEIADDARGRDRSGCSVSAAIPPPASREGRALTVLGVTCKPISPTEWRGIAREPIGSARFPEIARVLAASVQGACESAPSEARNDETMLVDFAIEVAFQDLVDAGFSEDDADRILSSEGTRPFCEAALCLYWRLTDSWFDHQDGDVTPGGAS